MSETHYTIWWQDGRNRQEFLSEAQMREQAAKIGFDADEVIGWGEAYIWEAGVEPNIDPTKDEIAGGCYKTWYEFVVHHYQDPNKTPNHGLERDVFEDEKEAWEFALERVKEGAFGVKVQVDEITNEGTNCNVDELGCPYIELDIDEELQELIYRREEVELNLCEPECLQEWRYEELNESLEKLNREIKKIVGSSDAEAH